MRLGHGDCSLTGCHCDHGRGVTTVPAVAAWQEGAERNDASSDCQRFWRRSSAWSEQGLHKAKVTGSNPVAAILPPVPFPTAAVLPNQAFPSQELVTPRRAGGKAVPVVKKDARRAPPAPFFPVDGVSGRQGRLPSPFPSHVNRTPASQRRSTPCP